VLQRRELWIQSRIAFAEINKVRALLFVVSDSLIIFSRTCTYIYKIHIIIPTFYIHACTSMVELASVSLVFLELNENYLYR
jgi:hypothetical protein